MHTKLNSGFGKPTNKLPSNDPRLEHSHASTLDSWKTARCPDEPSDGEREWFEMVRKEGNKATNWGETFMPLDRWFEELEQDSPWSCFAVGETQFLDELDSTCMGEGGLSFSQLAGRLREGDDSKTKWYSTLQSRSMFTDQKQDEPSLAFEMRVIINFELSVSRNSKEQRLPPFQKDVLAHNQVKDAGPPPPYIEHLDTSGLSETGSDLVCTCVANSSKSSRVSGSKATPRSRISRTSMKRLIRPVAKMFKSSHSQLDHSPADSHPIQNDAGPAEPQRGMAVWLHELSAERGLGELPGDKNFPWTWPDSNNVPELDGEASIHGYMSSKLGAQTSWPRYTPLLPAEDISALSPLSPLDRGLPTRGTHSVLKHRIHATVSPQSPVAPQGLVVNNGATGVANHEDGVKPIELDAEFSIYRGTQKRHIDQAGFRAIKHLSHGVACLRDSLLVTFRKALGKQIPQSKGILNDDGELPVLWDSTIIQEPLMGMAESIMHQLEQQGVKVVRGLGEGAANMIKGWNEALRHHWNDRGTHSVRDLPFFLLGWLSTKCTILDHGFGVFSAEGSRPRVYSGTLATANGELSMPFQNFRAGEGEDRACVSDVRQIGVELPVETGFVSPTLAYESPKAGWAAFGAESPPLAHQGFPISTAATTPADSFVWDSPAEIGSMISTPSTEYSLQNEIFEFDHCRIEGCYATFSDFIAAHAKATPK
ncbi:hypothetical protein FKW77_000525 [Venturia effusa]|uniref:Uncharacterized protein n=1 Tax=Venturia effusa TaxID=50376 RepID=A0A517KYW1_9PEZI|nr:hypothetical protein FKW77_000525 [Venturia effusa]